MNGRQRSQQRKKEIRAAKRPKHGDKYADKPKGREREFSDAVHALAEMYGPEWSR